MNVEVSIRIAGIENKKLEQMVKNYALAMILRLPQQERLARPLRIAKN